MDCDNKTGERKALIAHLSLDDSEQVSLCEVLDRILHKGAVVVGEATISVADIDLVYLGLQVVLTSIETARSKSAMSPGDI
jgi:hypothetical protein